MMPDSSTPPPPISAPAAPLFPAPIVIASGSPNHKKKIVLVGITIVTLIAGVITATLLVLRQQRLATEAWDCSQYSFSVSQTGEVTLSLSQNYRNATEPAQTVAVLINGQNAGTFSAPQISRGQTITLGTVTVPPGTFTWEVVGQKDCRNSGQYVFPSPTVSPTISPTTTPPEETPGVTPSESPSPSVSPSPTDIPEPTLSPTVSPTDSPTDTPAATTTPPVGGDPGPTSTPAPTGVPDPTATPIVPQAPPSPTPITQIPATGTADATWILTLGGLLLIGFGTLLFSL